MAWLNNIGTSIGNNIALTIINSTYWICLFTCIISLIIYACGVKKAGRVATVSFVVYFLSQCCKLGLK